MKTKLEQFRRFLEAIYHGDSRDTSLLELEQYTDESFRVMIPDTSLQPFLFLLRSMFDHGAILNSERFVCTGDLEIHAPPSASDNGHYRISILIQHDDRKGNG